MQKLPKNCSIIEMPTIVDKRGALTVADQQQSIPFEVKRVFWIYDVNDQENRGEHSHDTNIELVFAVKGAFTMTIDDGETKADVRLDRPEKGLLVAPWTWGKLHDFEPGTLILCLASHPYMAEGYIHDYEEFLRRVKTR